MGMNECGRGRVVDDPRVDHCEFGWMCEDVTVGGEMRRRINGYSRHLHQTHLASFVNFASWENRDCFDS